MKHNNVEIFNAILNECNDRFRNRIPKATNNNIMDIANKIFNNAEYEAEYNEFLGQLLNKIGLTLFRSHALNNRFSKYIYYGMEFGDVIEEITFNLPVAMDYKPNAPFADGQTLDPFIQKIPDVKANYISNSTKRVYQTTIFKNSIYKAFNSADGLNRVIDNIVGGLNASSEIDEYTIFKDVLNSAITNTKFEKTPQMELHNEFKVVDRESGLLLINQIKNIITNMILPNNCYNSAGITKQLSIDDIVIFIRSDVANLIQTYVLSSAYNKNDLSFTPSGFAGEVTVEIIEDFGGVGPYKDDLTPLHRVYNDDGSFKWISESSDGSQYRQNINYYSNYMLQGKKLENNIVALVAEKRLPIIATQRIESSTIYNPRGLYTNFWLHVWRTYGFSEFANFCTIYEPYNEPTINIKKKIEFNIDKPDDIQINIEGEFLGETITLEVTPDRVKGDSVRSIIINDKTYQLISDGVQEDWTKKSITFIADSLIYNIQPVVENVKVVVNFPTVENFSFEVESGEFIGDEITVKITNNITPPKTTYDILDKVLLNQEFVVFKPQTNDNNCFLSEFTFTAVEKNYDVEIITKLEKFSMLSPSQDKLYLLYNEKSYIFAYIYDLNVSASNCFVHKSYVIFKGFNYTNQDTSSKVATVIIDKINNTVYRSTSASFTVKTKYTTYANVSQTVNDNYDRNIIQPTRLFTDGTATQITQPSETNGYMKIDVSSSVSVKTIRLIVLGLN